MKKSVFVLLCLFVSGCQFGRDTALDLSVENLKNMDTVREVAENCRMAWPTESGLIKAAIGPGMDELSVQDVNTINELDLLATKDPNDITDSELGTFLGLKLRLYGSVVRKLLEQYAPNVLKLLPLIL